MFCMTTTAKCDRATVNVQRLIYIIRSDTGRFRSVRFRQNDIVFISLVHVRQRQAANVNRDRSKMFSHLSLKDLCCIALLLDEEEENKKRKRRFGTHKIFKKRKISGEYWTLFRQLMDDEEKFLQYFRMPICDFNVLLGKIENSIKKQNTTFKEAIGPREKLAVCLR